MPPGVDVEFVGTGGETLVGTIDLPDKAPEAYALVAHCFSGGRNSAATKRIALALTERGLAVLRFDFTGFGDSGGSFIDSTFSSNVSDLRRAADHLREHYEAPTLIVGHSLGGAAVLAAAPTIPEIAAVATIGAPADPAHLLHLFDDRLDEIEANGTAEVELAGARLKISKEFVQDLRSYSDRPPARDVDLPLLILHSPEDEIVPIDNANGIYRAANHPKSFICLDGADHLLTRRRDAERAALLIAAWADPYLPESFTPDID